MEKMNFPKIFIVSMQRLISLNVMFTFI